MPNNQHRVLVPWEHLSCRVRSSFPEQGVTCHIFLHSAEVCPSKRDQSLAAQPGVHSRPHFRGVGPSHWSKPFTAFSTLPWFHLPAILGYHHWSITTSHITYENRFSILFEMLEFEVNTLQVVSKPVQPRDMSKINLPCVWKVMESDTWRYSWSPCSTEIQPLSGKDNV
jgi:hypothetical protein